MGVRTVVRSQVSVVSEVVAVQCNGCGKEQALIPSRFDHGRFELYHDMHNINLSGGYGDKYPGDMQSLSFTVCGDCLYQWVQTFKVPVDSEVNPSLRAIHSESGDTWIVDGDWACPESTKPKWFDLDAEDIAGELPALGVWEHWKGQRYEVLSMARSYEAPDELLVVYRALYGDSQTFVRPLTMWSELVGSTQHTGGALVPRFRLIQ